MYLGGVDDYAPHLDFNGYLFMALLFCSIFLVQHMVLHVILRITYTGYMRLAVKEKHEYRM